MVRKLCNYRVMKSEETQSWPTVEERQLIRASFLRLIPSWEGLNDHLYASIFRDHAEVQALFAGDMERQKEKLTLMLATAVDLLDDESGFQTLCRECGARHVGYGAQAGHYPVVLGFLVQGLADLEEPKLSASEAAAWTKFAQLVVREMLIGADQTNPAPPQG
jgi:hemoglobin-like flavoprotein